MNRRLKYAVVMVAVLALAAVVAVPILKPQPARVETGRAVRGPLRVTVDGEGRTRARERFVVAAPVTGLLRRITLRSGDAVHAGATVALIEPARLSPASLTEPGAPYVPQSAVVRSPVSGRVLRVVEQSERVVAMGTPLLELSNIAQLEAAIDVLSTEAVKVAPGAVLLIENWGGDRPLEGRVRLIEPAAFTKVSALGIEEQRVNVIADFTDPTGRIGDGFRVEARIVVWEGEDVLKVPASALFRHGQGWSVFVVEGGRARRREVEAGRRAAFEAEIVRGVEEGAEVILHPSDEIDEGARVEAGGGATPVN